MGSKRSMLKNGLGELVRHHSRYHKRVVDLFCGAGSVSWFAAQHTSKPTLAVDLQSFAVTLCRAVIERSYPINEARFLNGWLDEVQKIRNTSRLWKAAVTVEEQSKDIEGLVREARALCEESSSIGPVWGAYGGHYFSPRQALTLDYMLKCLPQNDPERSVCLAAVIATAGRCAASPGHTAQPFQPTPGAEPHLRKAWNLDPLLVYAKALREIVRGTPESWARPLSQTLLKLLRSYNRMTWSSLIHHIQRFSTAAFTMY